MIICFNQMNVYPKEDLDKSELAVAEWLLANPPEQRTRTTLLVCYNHVVSGNLLLKIGSNAISIVVIVNMRM